MTRWHGWDVCRGATRIPPRFKMAGAALVAGLISAACGGGNGGPGTAGVATSQGVRATSGAAPTTIGSSPAPSGLQHGEISVGGAIRTYRVFAPPGLAPGRPAPLVFVLHGSGGDVDSMADSTHFDRTASANGFIVAYPQGQSGLWNAGLCCPVAGADDVGFLTQLLDRLESRYPVDTSRVFVAGGSLGAMMAYRFACERADRVGAVVSVAGAMILADCHPTRPVSVLEIHGTADTNVAYNGGPLPAVLGATAEAPATKDLMAEWARLDRCGSRPAVSTAGPLTTESWSGCADASTVRLISVAGATHGYYLPSAAAPNNALDSTEVAAAFLTSLPPRR